MSEQADFEALLEYLARTRDFDFTGYKRASLMRRVTKRMHEVGIEGFADLQSRWGRHVAADLGGPAPYTASRPR